MSTYQYCKWSSASADSPYEIYSELDVSRFETRKIEKFRDGRIGYAASAQATAGTRLGIIAVPSLYEINSQSEFQAKTITKDEFEKLWAKVVPA